MATIVTDLHCDLTQNVKPQFLHGNLFSQDNAANTINVHVFNDGEPATLGGSISANVIRSDGATVAVSGAIDGNKAYIILPQACYAVPGVLKIIIKNTESTTVTTIAAVVANVYASSTDTVVDPGQIIPSVAALIAQIEAAVDSIPVDYSGLLLTLAKDYTQKPYIVGEYAWQGGVLKRCIVPITTAETYTAAHWTNAVLGDDVTALKSATNNSKDFAAVPVNFTTTMNVQSAINASTGANAETGARTGYIQYNKLFAIRFPETEYIFTVWTYTNNSTTSASYSPTGKAYTTNDAIVKPITGTNPCFRIGIKRVDGGQISSSDASALFAQIKFYYFTDTTLLMSGVPADAKATGEGIQTVASAESVIRNQVFKYNSIDALVFGNGGSRSDNGIDYTRNADGTWTLDGTAIDASTSNIINSTATIPDYIIPGKTYTLKFDGTIVPIRFYFYYTDTSRNNHFTVSEDDKDITIPNDAIGLIVRFQIASGTSFTNETIGVHLISELSSGGTNIYNITVEPEITTDTHNWLMPSGDTTDMAAAIVAMLTETGYCKLAPGVFYVGGGLNIPSGATLEGCGRGTVIQLLSSVSNGYAVKIKNYATVKDLTISGSTSTLTPSGDIGTRHGILFEAAYGLESGNETSHCMVNNVWIENFTGAGIKCYRTSINYAKGLYVEQAFINRCHTGINIELLSEFNKFVNVCIARCFNACVNNGGNNVFTSCTFHATNIGFLMDDTDGTHGNNGHGTMTACTFCHIGSNTGSAITARNIKNGFSFSACQVWYNSIDLTDCDGFIFNSFEFGKGIHANKGATINITGGNTVMFNGCVFMDDVNNPPEITITDNTKVKFTGCYGSASGNAVDGT